MIIRKYIQQDADDIKYICLNSDGENTDTEKTNEYVLKTYCEYYIETEPDNCLVAVDDDGKVAGYVICAEDFDRFCTVFHKNYVSQVKKLSLFRAYMASSSANLQRKYKEEYPAHLHINILPQYQRQGLGGSLIDELCDVLKHKNVKGLMLTVDSANTTGIAFYKKYGFKMLERSGKHVAFGIKL